MFCSKRTSIAETKNNDKKLSRYQRKPKNLDVFFLIIIKNTSVSMPSQF